MSNLRYYDCHSGQDTQMLYDLVTLDKVRSLLSNPRQITFRLYSFCHELRFIEFPIDLCMRDKKEFAFVLSIAVEMTHFMKKSSNL